MLVLVALLVLPASAALGPEIESLALLGLALGGVLALVPDRTVLVRLGGFGIGLVLARSGYLFRAALLLDSVGGRSVAVGVVLLVCVLIAATTMDRPPLWTLLLGTAGMAGAFEYTYAAASPEVASTSVTVATALLLTVALGFLAVTAARSWARMAMAAVTWRVASAAWPCSAPRQACSPFEGASPIAFVTADPRETGRRRRSPYQA